MYLSNLVKIMLPSELPFNIALLAATAIIVISYAILLVKVKPSITKKEEPDIRSETKKSSEPQKSSKEPGTKVESKKVVHTKTHAETSRKEEKQKEGEDEKTKKSFFLFGETSFESCKHKFGYLNSLPKNTPIPDECFGCPQIVECLKISKTK